MSDDKKNQYGLCRDIPNPIARQIRQECGFGCVVCGSSIYQYEHIDPEFKDAHEHDPGKIALLCGSCHEKVTRKQWSKEKIRKARAEPVSLQQGFSREFFDYGAEHPDVLIGSAYFYRPDCVLRVFGQDLLVLRGSEAPGAPYRISGSFFHANGRLMFEVEENCWKGVTGNWDIEMSGPRITIRRGPGDIALVLRTEPRKSLVIERLDMYFKGVRVFADERGVCFGPPEKELYGFKGTIINPVCCLDVSKDDGRQISCAVQLGTPFGGQFTNNTICAAELAFCIRGQGLVLGIGYQAIKVTGDLVKILP